jgi:hypothetical protein
MSSAELDSQPLSRRPRTPDVWWPDCGNYEQPGSDGRDHLRSRTYELDHRVSRHEQFCNRVHWLTEDYLESIAYPLVDAWHRSVYAFGHDGEVTACQFDKFRAWAYMEDPNWLSGDYFRLLQESLLAAPEWKGYYIALNNTRSDQAVLKRGALTLNGELIPPAAWDERVTAWRRRMAADREAHDGSSRRVLAHLKATLPDLARHHPREQWFLAHLRQAGGMLTAYLHAPNYLGDWQIPDEIVADNFLPAVNDAGLLSVANMHRDDAAGILYEAELVTTTDRYMDLRFFSKETQEEHMVRIDRTTAVSDEELKKRYPPTIR